MFEGTTRTFLTEDVGRAAPPLAVDLGCGPGHTTQLLAECTGATRTVGIDSSASFLAAARTGAPTGVEFLEHDVTTLPFPTGPVDILYCRLLLAHIPEPEAMLTAWMTQLTPGGLLAVDEVESITTVDPVLAHYEQLVVELIASRCAHMYAGRLIDVMKTPGGWRRRSSRLVRHPVPVPDAARMFGLNLDTWRHDPHMREHHDAGELEELSRALDALAAAPTGNAVEWGLRQVVFERTAER